MKYKDYRITVNLENFTGPARSGLGSESVRFDIASASFKIPAGNLTMLGECSQQNLTITVDCSLFSTASTECGKQVQSVYKLAGS